MKRLVFILLLFHSITSTGQAVQTIALSHQEKQLLRLLNEERLKRNLPVLKIITELQLVARAHINDLMNHPPARPCNLHSWSEFGKWTPCCYTDDHAQASKMWSKPKEIAGFEANGFEIAYSHSQRAIPEAAMASWKKSQSHYALIANLNQWKDNQWIGVGVSIAGQYAVIWFAE